MRKAGISAAIAALVFFQSASLIFAQEEKSTQEWGSYFSYLPSSGAEAMPGKVAIIEAGSEYSYEFRVFDKLPVKLSLENDYIGIKNSTPVKLPAQLTELTTDIEITLPFFNLENTYIRLGMSPSFYAEEWSFPASSFRIPSRSYLAYRPSEKLTLVAGVAVFPEFESPLFPILGLIYKPNDRLTFNIVPHEPGIFYILNDRFTLFCTAGGSFGEYEVARENLKNAVLQYSESNAGLGLTYKVNKSIEASFAAGGVFNRYLKYRDSLGKVSIKNGAFMNFEIDISM